MLSTPTPTPLSEPVSSLTKRRQYLQEGLSGYAQCPTGECRAQSGQLTRSFHWCYYKGGWAEEELAALKGKTNPTWDNNYMSVLDIFSHLIFIDFWGTDTMTFTGRGN